MFLGFAGGVAELIGVASVIPYILLVAKPGFIEDNAIIQRIYHTIEPGSEKQFLLILLAVVLFLFLIKGAITVWLRYLNAKYSFDVASGINKRKIRQFLSSGYLWFRMKNSHQLVHEAKNIPFQFANGVMIPYLTFTVEFVLLTFLFVLIAFINLYILSALVLILAPLISLVYFSMKNKLKRLGEEINEVQPKAYQSLHQLSQAYPEIKLYGKEQFFTHEFLVNQQKIHHNYALTHPFGMIPSKFIEIGAIIGILIVSLYTFISGQPLSQLLIFLSVFATATYKIMPSLNKIFSSVVKIRQMQYTLDFLSGLPFMSEEDPRQLKGKLKLKTGIQLKNISYRYPGKKEYVLNNVNLEIPGGKITGIGGRSGEGKTTLLYILMRFLVEENGEMTINGKKLTKEENEKWQKNIGFVRHNGFLLDGTIRENIAFGDEPSDIDEQKLEKVLKGASLKKFVKTLEKGWDTEIGEGGLKLSGGQKQRLAIARALYRDAGFFVFDEATNALDLETEREILQSIRKLKESGKTIVIVSHRLSALKICDHLFVMEKGIIKKFSGQEFENKEEAESNLEKILTGITPS